MEPITHGLRRCVFYGDLYPNKECYEKEIGSKLKLLIQARKKFAYGIQREYLHDYNYLGFTREGDANHGGCAVIVSNAENTS